MSVEGWKGHAGDAPRCLGHRELWERTDWVPKYAWKGNREAGHNRSCVPLVFLCVPGPLGWSCCQQDVLQPVCLVLTSLLCAGL